MVDPRREEFKIITIVEAFSRECVSQSNDSWEDVRMELPSY